MRNFKYILLAASLLFILPSCFQDLGQNPPFDYPEEPEGPSIGEDGLLFYMSFDGDYKDAISDAEATKVGNPVFAAGKIGQAYAGATNGYLTFRLSNIPVELGSDLTIGFWYKVNNNPNKAGIISIGPVTEGAADNLQNNRTSGVRIFREEAGSMQRFKANVGNGTADGWLDGGANADIDPATADWLYFTLTITEGKALFYIDGEQVASNNLSKISWEGCDIMSIGSGAPRFTEWGHLSDNSLIDELRIYNKTLTVEEIQEIMSK